MRNYDGNETSIDFCLLWDMIGLLINVNYMLWMKDFMWIDNSIELLEVPST